MAEPETSTTNPIASFSDVEPPSFSNLSYNKQYDQLFSQPLNLRRPVPKPDKESQAFEEGSK